MCRDHRWVPPSRLKVLGVNILLDSFHLFYSLTTREQVGRTLASHHLPSWDPSRAEISDAEAKHCKCYLTYHIHVCLGNSTTILHNSFFLSYTHIYTYISYAVYIHTHIHTHTHIYTHAYIHVHTHIYKCTYICVRANSLQLCLTLCNPMDCSSPGSSVHRILQTWTLEWVTTPSSERIFPTQGSNPRLLRLLHWQTSSLLLYKAILKREI